MNNEAGNVHRICHDCHYKWHRANDKNYNWNNPVTTAHSPVTMTEADLQEALMYALQSKANKRVKIMED